MSVCKFMIFIIFLTFGKNKDLKKIFLQKNIKI